MALVGPRADSREEGKAPVVADSVAVATVADLAVVTAVATAVADSEVAATAVADLAAVATAGEATSGHPQGPLGLVAAPGLEAETMVAQMAAWGVEEADHTSWHRCRL